MRDYLLRVLTSDVFFLLVKMAQRHELPGHSRGSARHHRHRSSLSRTHAPVYADENEESYLDPNVSHMYSQIKNLPTEAQKADSAIFHELESEDPKKMRKSIKALAALLAAGVGIGGAAYLLKHVGPEKYDALMSYAHQKLGGEKPLAEHFQVKGGILEDKPEAPKGLHARFVDLISGGNRGTQHQEWLHKKKIWKPDMFSRGLGHYVTTDTHTTTTPLGLTPAESAVHRGWDTVGGWSRGVVNPNTVARATEATVAGTVAGATTYGAHRGLRNVGAYGAGSRALSGIKGGLKTLVPSFLGGGPPPPPTATLALRGAPGSHHVLDYLRPRSMPTVPTSFKDIGFKYAPHIEKQVQEGNLRRYLRANLGDDPSEYGEMLKRLGHSLPHVATVPALSDTVRASSSMVPSLSRQELFVPLGSTLGNAYKTALGRV